jgi:hypothetical protein
VPHSQIDLKQFIKAKQSLPAKLDQLEDIYHNDEIKDELRMSQLNTD